MGVLTIEETRIIIGILLLTLGRKLFWLFVGAVGFVLGTRFAGQFMQGQPDNVVIVFALVVGLVGAILAMFLKKAALGVAGFFAGGYLLWRLALFNGWDAGGMTPWIYFLVGGVIGGALMNTFFTWAIIALSAIGGASLICESLQISFKALSANPQVLSMLFVGLAVAGVLFQLGVLRKIRSA